MTIEDALRAAGWTPWTGGECPVEEDSYPQVMTASGEVDCEAARDFDWSHDDDAFPHDRVIAYRVIT